MINDNKGISSNIFKDIYGCYFSKMEGFEGYLSFWFFNILCIYSIYCRF